MSILESVILMSGLIFCLNLLYWSKQTWGMILTILMLFGALAATLYWPLMLGAAIGLVSVIALHRFQPELARGETRENTLRDWIQHLMSLSMLLVGIQYVVYYALLGNGVTVGLTRPDVVDAFLPIAGGLELKAIIMLGLWDQNHPAAAVMLFTVLLSGVLCKRAFCGWICPLGHAGTYLYQLRTRFIKGKFLPPSWVDWPLRMVKYLLLVGLLYIVVLAMPSNALPHYLNGYYQKIADLKMGMFFITPSLIEGILIGLVLALVVWQDRAFCRYLCPYGAVLGLLSFFSPLKVRRDTAHCLNETKGMDCDKCTRACPARIKVHTVETVRTDECQACMRCVSACPQKKALGVRLPTGKNVTSRGVLILLLLLMFGIPLLAYLGGFWHSQVSDETRMELMKYIHQINH
ncbi:4Fe-4S binding protein [Vibrio sp. VB16]|uniref:4Fe-4S binding protein n=1 Tax=Vibrio sp. VB16 TaxID=2785746 RepID=UPI00189DD935|nr:4Fe-4S binding protein [Vibrio sp. VB16]UGA57330.1 4Fe-4S binding protein [Vibrio sp. VB16]